MKLRSLSLTNVRKFAGQTATISGIGEGVSVVSQANEFGKSTFFDALHALFFLKYGAATRDVKSLQPRVGGPVRISAEIDVPAGRFTVEKSFLAQKRAIVRDAGGTVVALDDEAEAWIARLLGSGLDGPAGLLWVRQGTTALEPSGNSGADKSEKERLLGARRDLLSSVAGEIDMVTGGRRMDRVIEAASQALAKLATATGQPKANGPWKAAQSEAETLAAQHEELERACSELARALTTRREVEARLKQLEEPKAQAALIAALDQAKARHDLAVAHADKLEQASGHAALRQLELERAQRELDALLGAGQAYADAQAAQIVAASGHDTASAARAQAEEAEQTARGHLENAAARLAEANAAREAAQNASLLSAAMEKHERLSALVAQVLDKRGAREEASAGLAALLVTPAALSRIEEAQLACLHAQAEAASGGIQIELSYEGAQAVHLEGRALAAGVHPVLDRQVFDLPQIGRMVIDPGSAASDVAQLTAARAALAQALADVGMEDLAAARSAAAARKAKTDEIALLEGVLSTLAPDGVAPLQAEVARARAALATLGSPLAPRDTNTPHDPAELLQAQEQAQQAHEHATRQYEELRERRDGARTEALQARTRRDAAQEALDAAAQAMGNAADFDTRKTGAARVQSLAAVAAQDAQTAVQALHDQAPDLATCQADLARARSACDNARDERNDLLTRRADLSATIRARAQDGIEERRDEVAGLMRRATERAAHFAHEAAGLSLLVEALREKRGAAQDAYFGPVQKELAPLLALLHGDAALSFDPASLLPQAMARGGQDEPLEMLSGGTQEQIAILTRLAFARLFARQGKPMPVILDDALVYSDDSRIVAMFTALHRVAHDQQVIVFSCRQMAFAELGGTRPQVTIGPMM